MARKSARAEPRDGEQTGALSASRVVLVVVRDSAKGGEIVDALQSRGLPTVQASTGFQALFWARTLLPALVLLDMNVKGARLLMSEFRRRGLLLAVVTDHGDERVLALDRGCLDAFPRSVEPEETAAKLTRLIRSHRNHPRGKVVAGPLAIDPSARRLVWKKREVVVSPLLFELAAYLAIKAGQFTPARVLLEDIWGEPLGSPNKVHLAIHRLRRRLGEPTDSPFLVGRRGHGYGVFPGAATMRQRGASLLP